VDIRLTPDEARVIGSLIEKQITAPDQYPLSLNALTNACNQKSNRDPVLEFDEAAVQDLVEELIRKHLVLEKSGFGSRVRKYQHRFCNTEFNALQLSEQELGMVCELLLRGAQTPGELRTHTNRLCHFRDVQEVESILDHLAQRSDGPFVKKLPREPGKRESRYAHLFSGDVDIPADTHRPASGEELRKSDHERLALLEAKVSELSMEIEALRRRLEQLTPEALPGAGEP
jgi:uncharacterized protein YceH (UPF0502 family)